MKLSSLKYILILCITAALFLKVGNVMSYLRYSSIDIENVLSNDDATEKEEKKVEAEYFNENFFITEYALNIEEMPKKVFVPQYFNKLSYFPEVLTPPPSV